MRHTRHIGAARQVIAGVVATVTAAAAVGLLALPASAASPGVADGGVVASAVPASFTPNIADGAVESMVQVGNLMVVGGTFTQVTPTAGPGAGTTVSRPYLFAFDATTGALDTSFLPAVNGEVDAIVPTADGTGVYVGGMFTTAGGVATRLAELDLGTGALVPDFNPSLNGPIDALALVGSRLFVAGTFTSVRSVQHNGLVSLNPATGALDPYLSVNLTGNHNYGRVANAAQARVGATDMAVSPDGSRMIVDGNFINAADPVNPSGYARDQIVSIDLGPDQATVDPNWNTNAFTNPCFSWAYDSYVRHVAWSPDGSYFVVAATGGYDSGSFEDCDAASRFDADSTGQSVSPAWITHTGTDSIYSVAVTSDAVYIGGHYRWLNNPYGQDNPQKGAVPRPGLGALNPANGVPLSWNPGRNPRGHGAEEIYATPAGIWVGSDTDYIGDQTYLREKLAFFPFAGGSAAVGSDTGDARTVLVAGASGKAFTANSFDPVTGIGAVAGNQPSSGGTLNWGSVQGAFELNGQIWFGKGGSLYVMNWDGRNGFGTPQLVDPYDDPYWDSVINGSPPTGTTYQGKVTDFYGELPNVTGMFYANNSIYYTLAGNSHLFSRAFSADTTPSIAANQVTGGVISPAKNTVTPASGSVDFSGARGMFVANGYLWYATKSDGALHKVAWNGTTYSGPSSVDTSAKGNWAGAAVFVSPIPPIPTAPPTMSVAASSTLVVAGQTDTIAWGSRNASSVVLRINGVSHGSVPTSGKGTVRMTTPGTYVYAYTASSQTASATKSVTITVWSQQQFYAFLSFLAWWNSHTPAQRAQLLAYFAYLAAHQHG